MLQVLQIVFPIFAIVGLGYVYALRHGPDMASANRLNLEIFTPALIFSVLAGEGFELARYADLALAARSIVHSKTFDNGTVCASEQALIVTGANVANPALDEALRLSGGSLPAATGVIDLKAFLGEH